MVAFAVLAVGFCAGRFSLPVFYPVFTDPKKFGWSHAQAAGGGSIVLLLIGLLGPLVGWLCDKYSPKAIILGGCVTCAAAMALLSTTQTQLQWYLFCTLLGIGIAAASLVPASMLIAPWFTKQRGLAVGVINAGVGLGGYIFPKLATRLITQDGPFAGVPDSERIPGDPADRDPVGHSPPRRPRSRRFQKCPSLHLQRRRHLIESRALDLRSQPVLRRPHMMGVQEHLVLYLRGQGLKPADAAQALSTLLGASAFGKLLGGAAADRFSSRVSMLLATSCLILGVCGLLAADPRSSAVYFAAAVFGLGFGGIFNAPSLIAFEYFGTERVGTILGLFMMFFGVGTSTGGVTAGAIFDQTHRYSTAFTVDLLSCVLAFVFLFAVGRRPSPSPLPLTSAVKKIA